MALHSRYTMFEFLIQWESEQTVRDEFGWVEGKEPGNAPWKLESFIYRVVSAREAQARERATETFRVGPGIRGAEIVSVTRFFVDAVIVELA